MSIEDPYQPDPKPASQKQIDFIRSLMDRLGKSNRKTSPKYLELREKIARAGFWAELKSTDASEILDQLLRVQKGG